MSPKNSFKMLSLQGIRSARIVAGYFTFYSFPGHSWPSLLRRLSTVPQPLSKCCSHHDASNGMHANNALILLERNEKPPQPRLEDGVDINCTQSTRALWTQAAAGPCFEECLRSALAT